MRISLFIALLFLSKFCFSQDEKDSSFKSHIQDFEKFIKKVEENFVDDIEVERLILSAKKQTIQSLDPYSKYYTKEESQERNKTWKGISYAGIGATLIQTNKGVMIYSIKKGYGAEKKRLQPGDIIYKIHDSICLNLKLNNVIKLLKGPPNTEVEITVKRDKLYKFEKIVRQNIISPSISFSDTIGNNIGLIKIDQFLRGSGQLFREKLEVLISKGATKIVLDLRGNRGGLVNETVKALSAVLKKGTIIYELKSNDLKSNYIDSTNLEPISTTIPMVLLVDNKTISSGEIFSGALQDLDRAVLIGQTTFGKGLVQRTYDLKYGSKLKVTISKYYTPSGRCVQRLEYYDRNLNDAPSEISDSLIQSYKTANGREVIDGRGIVPDTGFQTKIYSELTTLLIMEDIIFNYVNAYVENRDSIDSPENYELTTDEYDAFVLYVGAQSDFEYMTILEKKFSEIKEILKSEDSFDEISNEFSAMEKKIKGNLNRDLIRYKDEILPIIENEIVARFYFQKGKAIHSFSFDPSIQQALQILKDSGSYNQILNK